MLPIAIGSMLLEAMTLAAAVLITLPAAPAWAAEETRPRQLDTTGTSLAKPDSAPSKSTPAALVVTEGELERPLWIDRTRVAEFPAAGGADQPEIRPVAPGEINAADRSTPAGPSSKSTAVAGSANLSPIYIDASGRLRALPGGVIVTFKGYPPADTARAELVADGLVPLRQLGDRMWLVESPAGSASLELASRLHTSGQYEFVQPNWWTSRTTK